MSRAFSGMSFVRSQALPLRAKRSQASSYRQHKNTFGTFKRLYPSFLTPGVALHSTTTSLITGQLKNLLSILGSGKRYFSLPKRPDRHWRLSNFLLRAYRGFFLRD
jgi:hypothetical protein